MPKLRVKLARRDEIAAATWAFTLGLDGQAFSFKPGQTIDLTYHNMPLEDPAGNRRTFSIASKPGLDHLQIATRVRGSGFKQSLLKADLGTTLELDGPYGSFTLPNKPSSVVLLTGGIGVTPFRSMALDAAARSLEHALLMIHSNRTPEEAPFLDELQRLASEFRRFTYRPTMTQADRSKRPWNGDRRRVDRDYLSEVIPSQRDGSLYYAAGPERFVGAVVQILKGMGIDEDQIRFEEFPGY